METPGTMMYLDPASPRSFRAGSDDDLGADQDGIPSPTLTDQLAALRAGAPEFTQCFIPENTGRTKEPGIVTRLPLSRCNTLNEMGGGYGMQLVVFNVGGEIYQSTSSTLRRAPFFDSLLRQAEEGQMSTTIDEKGRYFIDRSGNLFGYILAFLRTQQWPSNERMEDRTFVDALRAEAMFYGLDEEELLPPLRAPEYVTLWQFRDDTALYVDCLEHMLRDDPDHQGSFRLCKYFGTQPLDAKTNTKRFKASTHTVQSMLAYFAARGWSLSHVVQGSMINHTTSADGQNRTGHGVQYILVKYGQTQYCRPSGAALPEEDILYASETHRTWGGQLGATRTLEADHGGEAEAMSPARPRTVYPLSVWDSQ